MSGNLTPGLSSVLFDAFHENAIFLFGPGPLDHLRIEDLLPAVQALHICTILQLLSDFFPILWLHCNDKSKVSQHKQSVTSNNLRPFYLRGLEVFCPKHGKKKRSGQILKYLGSSYGGHTREH